jgi:exodeoxyribonuclease V alpha subunit
MQKVACALATRSQLLILTGGPGTGKTFTVVRILALLLKRRTNLRILLSAPTGKAAARLTESITHSLAAEEMKALPEDIQNGIPSKATTIHQMLRSKKNSRSFHHNEENPLHADVVVIDEASMIDLEMMAAIMRALPAKALLILVGDKDQLSSVEAGSVMGDICLNYAERGYSGETLRWILEATGEEITYPKDIRSDALAQQTVMLKHSVRFSEESGVGQLAAAVNSGSTDQALALLRDVKRFQDIAWIKKEHPSKALIDALCLGEGSDENQGYKHYLDRIQSVDTVPKDPNQQDIFFGEVLEAFGTFQVLSAVREGSWGVENLNRMILARLEKKGILQSPPNSGALWYAGRPVMATRNDYELGIMNGDVGMTLPFTDEDSGERVLRVVFKDPESSKRPFRVILPSRLTDVETVFAMTVHKSQGSEFGHVALMLPDPEHAPVLTRELLYTGITRAKKRLTLVGGREEQLKVVIERKTQRSSRLGDLLTTQAL